MHVSCSKRGRNLKGKKNKNKCLLTLLFCLGTMKLLKYSGSFVRGHTWDMKKVSVTGAGCLQECKNTEFVSELSKTGFCKGG